MQGKSLLTKWLIQHRKERFMTEGNRAPLTLLAALGLPTSCSLLISTHSYLLEPGVLLGATTQRTTRGCFPPFRLWLFEMQLLILFRFKFLDPKKFIISSCGPADLGRERCRLFSVCLFIQCLFLLLSYKLWGPGPVSCSSLFPMTCLKSGTYKAHNKYCDFKELIFTSSPKLQVFNFLTIRITEVSGPGVLSQFQEQVWEYDSEELLCFSDLRHAVLNLSQH